MAEPTGIEDVRERARDFTRALRKAGAEDVAARIDGYASGFVDGAQVRRSVDAIHQQLRYFRAYPEELPDLPVVQIAANRLEDACKAALRAGVIVPARLSLRAQGKRKLSLMLITALIGCVVLGLPLALALAGVDLQDLPRKRELPGLQLKKGSYRQVTVHVLSPALLPAATTGVELMLPVECPGELGRGISCTHAGKRSFGSRELPSYEVMLPDQAYGLFVGFADAQLLGDVGRGEVLLSAGPQTPEGHYVLPLTAAFLGYSPARCNLLLELSGACTREQRGARARHEGLPVPTLHVQVVAAGPEPERVAAKQAEQLRVEQRAAQLASAVQQIGKLLDDTQLQLRQRRFDLVQQRVDELGKLFEPLDALAVAGAEAEPLPAEVVNQRARFEQAQRALHAFRERAFEAAYRALTGPRATGTSDEQLFGAVAHRLGISGELLAQIYTEHADVLAQRAARAQELEANRRASQQAAVVARCGPLPRSAWRVVHDYLLTQAGHRGVRVRLNECLTPRLSEASCWSVVCDFDEVTSARDTLDDEVVRRKWLFSLRAERVVGHQPAP